MVKVTYDRRQCLGTFIKYYDDEISEWAKNNNTYTTPKREVYELDEAFCSGRYTHNLRCTGVIVPKIAVAEASCPAEAEASSPTEAEASPQYVTHILLNREAELWPTLYNVLDQYLHRNSHPYLFAHFAWAILLQVKDFVLSSPRNVVQLHITTVEDGVKKKEYKTGFITAEQLMKDYGGGGTKAATPMGKGKRRRRTASTVDSNSVESSSEDESMDDDTWDLVEDEEMGRKRRRQQQSSEETALDIIPFLPPDVEADLKEDLLRGMADAQEDSREETAPNVEAGLKEALGTAVQQASQGAQEASREVEMTLRWKQR
ncbi:hypothetical protein V8E54_012818 [Elaphomyces granulatus]